VEVRVAGHQVETGESLRDTASRRMEEITEKYFSRAVGANVTFGRGPNNDYTCDIVAPVAQGMVLKASHKAAEGYTVFSGGGADSENQEELAPAIVAETRVDIPETSVSDAVMLMDLRNTTALMFKNSGTGELNMIYRREDGNIGWVEPQTA
jgi:ribosome-associated translation inhibitor RaiA